MKEETKKAIIEEAIRFARRTPSFSLDIGYLRRAFPFHALFFTDEGLRAFKNQRSIVTRLGQTLIPRVAMLIASDKYEDVKREYRIQGEADEGMIAKIQEILIALRSGQRRPPNAIEEWDEIKRAASGQMSRYQVVADLCVGDFAPDGPLFLEIKSPRPNLDICAQSKEKMLVFRAIMFTQGKPDARAYLGLWYNPDIEPDSYSHGFTRQIMDMENEVLLGEKLWDTIGGPGTYDELLDVLKQAEEEIRKEAG